MRNSNITKDRIRVALLLVLAASMIGLAPPFRLVHGLVHLVSTTYRETTLS